MLLALGLSSVAGMLVVALLSLQSGTEAPLGTLVLMGIFSAVLLLGVGAIGWHVGVRLTRQQLGESLREARLQAQVLVQLQPDWQWATDAAHHLIRWQAPQGALGSAWAGGASAATQALWERFELAGDETTPAASSLRDRLEAHASFADVRVKAREGFAWGLNGDWLLRGIACFDHVGRFAGYQGTAERQVEAPQPTPAAAPDNAAVAAQAGSDLQEDHAAFSYTVSHDLRAPLRIVEGFTRILKEDYGRALDRVGNEHLDRVSAAAGRMNGMIDALLSLAQLSAQPLQNQPVNLSQLAGLVIEDLRRGTPERALDLHIQSPLVVQGDPTLLRMLLENLLGNAWKYSGKREQAQIRLTANLDGDDKRWVYCVSDNGAGFDMRFADRLFGAFQRLHSASDFQGTGVGLASVRRIVRRHGGEIWAESEVGKGAQFYFTLS